MKNLLKEWKCDVVCFQEIKLDCTNSSVVKSLWGMPFVEEEAVQRRLPALACFSHTFSSR